MTDGKIYVVKFKEPPFGDGKTEFYFTSLTAIYQTFTKEQIGCAVERLYRYALTKGETYSSKLCCITGGTFNRNKRNSPSKGLNT